jgi:hypothetical protein
VPAASPASPVAASGERHTITYIYRWDLDKTYLQTDFDSVRALLRTAIERASDKRNVPGAATLLRELRRATRAGETTRVCFVSGSPKQMRRVLTEKLRLDGIEFDEFILKPNLRNLLTGRFRALREQVGYKLPALLTGRAGVSRSAREVCFGDDAESDAFIYSLYGDLLAGRVARPQLEQILERAGTYPDDAGRTVSLFESIYRGPTEPGAAATGNLPELGPFAHEVVGRIFIHLDRRSPPRRFDRYGARLVPIYNYFQAALVLHQDGRLAADAVVRVAVEMVDRHEYSLEALRNSLQDLLRRGRLTVETVRQLGAAIADGQGEADLLPALGSLPSTRDLLRALARSLRDLGPSAGAVPSALSDGGPLVIDYLKALEEDLPRHRR